MKQLTVISGKGGTGKTTLTASFAASVKGIIIADADVSAPDLHLLLRPQILQSEEFMGAKVAVIDKDTCNQCGECEKSCRFKAIKNIEIDTLLCEGCGVCAYICPQEAIAIQDQLTGHVYISETRFGPLAYANLCAGAEASGKLVTRVREVARKLCQGKSSGLIMIDGSPGIGCPVIASITGVDLALIVTEPTLSGLADLERVVHLTEHFHIKALVCINKYDINLKNTQKICEFCQENKVGFVGMIPFDEEVNRALNLGRPVVEVSHGPTARAIRKVWETVLQYLGLGEEKGIESLHEKEA